MDRTERFYKIDHLLRSRGCVPIDDLLRELEISKATFKRDLEYMRDRFHAPIVWDRDRSGYRFDEAAPDRDRYELPGMWFNASEAHALLAMEALLERMEPGLLSAHLAPLRERLSKLLGSTAHSADEVRRRVRIVPMAHRRLPAHEFEVVAHALLKRRRIDIRYRARTTDEETTREVSPQRLVHYRDNWYLDAWCHLRRGLRSFSMDCVLAATLSDKPAQDVAETELDAVLGSGYGIFSGKNVQWAKLQFTPVAARWVSAEAWHPQQRSSTQADGSYLLEVPYADDRELIMDIMRYGPDCKVLGPASLRQRLREQLEATLRSA